MGSERQSKRPCGKRPCHILTGVFLATTIALAVALGIVLSRSSSSSSNTDEQQDGVCYPGYPIKPKNLDDPDIFDELGEKELIAVRDFLLKQDSLELTSFEDAQINSSYIYSIDMLVPNKTDALKYLDDSAGTAAKPIRRAKVYVVGGSRNPPVLEEYIVWPLPTPTEYVLYNNPAYNRNPIPYHSRAVDAVEFSVTLGLVREVTEKAYHILIESFGMGFHNCTADGPCLTFFDTAPRGFKSGQRESWWWSLRHFDGFYIHPVGFNVRIFHEGNDISKWNVTGVYYNEQLFTSVEDLVNKYDAGTIKKIRVPVPDEKARIYSTYKRRGPNVSDKPKQGPRMYEPQGRRYNITGHHVEYMGWKFNIRVRSSTGVQIFDARFFDTRIAYEVSMQEASVIYSGWSPMQSTSNYFDVSWLVGASLFELAPGIDCPENAVFLDAWHLSNSGKPNHYKNVICIFELNTGIPLRRHYANDYNGAYTFYGGMVDNVLVVRSATTVWNYDYIFDYIFHQNGGIEVKASATGYVQATFYTKNEAQYGHKIYDSVIADIHQHLFHYKVDLDVAGLSNSFYTYDISVENVTLPWYPNIIRTQQKYTKNIKTTETKAALEYKFEQPKYYVFRNDKVKNKYGNSKGYRIQINSMSKQILPMGTGVENGMSWARYQLAVTKYKDEEETSSSIYCQNDPVNPVLNFQKYIDDDESIRDEDLVAWITVGKQHIPHSEDCPSTATTGNQLVFYILPYNYFDEDASMASIDNTVVRPKDDFTDFTVDRNGRPQDVNCKPRKFKFYYNGTWGF